MSYHYKYDVDSINTLFDQLNKRSKDKKINKSEQNNLRVRLIKGGKYGDVLVKLEFRGKINVKYESGTQNQVFSFIPTLSDMVRLVDIGRLFLSADLVNHSLFSVKDGLNDFNVNKNDLSNRGCNE
tara:strand:+ start:68 stop:445 length:378 start_codon:yes stop_codon:yes gene_type:complete